ncbi:MAG: hypothetical protein RML12_06575 [Xanthomonadales bacterium]|nr:hypothetical protein [Xanthomonadales bacterium]
MDGADGMAAQQAVFLAGALTVLAGLAGAGGWALFALAVGAATLGFLPFNLPRARLFLGDVGSTTLGFFLGAAALALVARGAPRAARGAAARLRLPDRRGGDAGLAGPPREALVYCPPRAPLPVAGAQRSLPCRGRRTGTRRGTWWPSPRCWRSGGSGRSGSPCPRSAVWPSG